MQSLDKKGAAQKKQPHRKKMSFATHCKSAIGRVHSHKMPGDTVKNARTERKKESIFRKYSRIVCALFRASIFIYISHIHTRLLFSFDFLFRSVSYMCSVFVAVFAIPLMTRSLFVCVLSLALSCDEEKN